MSRYRSVIIGLSGIGANRPPEPEGLPIYGAVARSHTSAYHRCPDTELVAVCDLDDERRKDCLERWKDVWPDLKGYTDYREMFDVEKPDIVSVATSDHLHADMVVEAAERKIPMIVCEKPIATTLDDADRMIAAAEANGVLLSVEHSRRWHPSFLQARELIRGGELGEARTVTTEMFSQRAMLFRNGTHAIDMMIFLAQGDPAWVTAQLEDGFEHFTEYKSDGGHDPTTDPYVSAYVRFANDVRGFVNFMKVDLPGSQWTVTCDGGRIEVSDRELKVVTGGSYREWSETPYPVDQYVHQHFGGFVPEIIHVHENGGGLVSPATEARKTLELMLGMLKSHELGNSRVDFPLS